jgi:hypothetical protein
MITMLGSNRMRGLMAAVALVAVSSLATVAPAQDVTEGNVAERVAAAKTAPEHEAIAAFFKAQATAAGDKVKEHEAMLASWEKGTSGRSLSVMRQHCQDAIASYKKLQKDYTAMAAEQETLAKKAK